MASKTLIVLRHAKSSWQTEDSDLNRPLSERGKRDAVAVGGVLKEYQLDRVLASNAARVQQTWAGAMEGGAKCNDVRVAELVYRADATKLLQELQRLDQDVDTALLIGHQPVLAELIINLAKPTDLTERIARKFPTSALAVLTYRGSWKSLGAGKAKLQRFEIPRG